MLNPLQIKPQMTFLIALAWATLFPGCDRPAVDNASPPTSHPSPVATSARPKFPVALLGPFYQANAEIEMDRHGQAAKQYRALLEEGSRDPAVTANLAVAMLALQDYDAATRLAREALDDAPANPNVRLIHAAAIWAQGRFSEAVDVLRRIETDAPGHLPAIWAMICAAEIQDDLVTPGAVLAAHEQMLSIAPRNLAALLSAARAFAAAGRLDESNAFMNRCATLIAEPDEAVQRQLTAMSEAVRAGDKNAAVRAVTLCRNLLRPTDRYRSDIIELGPGIQKIPPVVPHPIYDLDGDTAKAVQAQIQFESATASLGLAALSEGAESLAIGLSGNGNPALCYLSRERGVNLFIHRDGKYHNETAKLGLGGDDRWDSAVFVDLNNDLVMDLVLSGPAGDRVLRGSKEGAFADVTSASGLTDDRGWPGACPYDFDNDGDLDLIRWSPDALALMRNDGEGSLSPIDGRPGFPSHVENIRSIQSFDLDDDGDVDLFITTGRGPFACRIISNERLGAFRDVTDEMKSLPAGFAAEPFIADTNHDGRLEIIDVGAGRRFEVGPEFIIEPGPLTAFQAGTWIGGAAADLDCNGTLDVIAWKKDGTTNLPDVRTRDGSEILPIDLNGDGLPDLLTSHGEVFLNHTKGAGHWLAVRLQALISGDSRFNAFGLHSTIEIRAGAMYQKRHVNGPIIHFGLGPHTHADVMRVVWPNGNYQDLAHRASDRLRLSADQLIIEEQSLKGSCPYLYAWNGERFEFVTDVLWRSALGMSMGTDVIGHHETANDYFKIEGRQLAPLNGRYVLQFTEELWETAYLDYCRLLVVDHPAGTETYVDERCVPPPYPPFEIHAFAAASPIAGAWDHEERDCRDLLRDRDGRYVTGFKPSRYQGLMEDHDLTLDLGAFPNDARIRLFLSGWLFPTDASINVAASQNPTIDARPPVIHVMTGDSEWTPLDIKAGFPSGKNKTMILDLTGAFTGDDHRIRISTNFAIYWDQAFVVIGDDPVETRVTELTVSSSNLHDRGFSHEFPRVPNGPTIPDYNSLDPNRCWRDLIGDYTRFGEVTALLQTPDGAYVIAGPGDEVTLHFDAGLAPPLPDGWVRDYVIHTDGWLKDGDLNSAAGKTVAPLPYHGMTEYPYPATAVNPISAMAESDAPRAQTRFRDQNLFRTRLRRQYPPSE